MNRTKYSNLSKLDWISIVLINCVPVFGVLFLGWDAITILALYWAEGVIIGLMTIFKMIVAQTEPIFLKLFLVLFFCLHYGGFLAVHGFMLFVFLAGFLTDGGNELVLPIDRGEIIQGIALMFVSYLIAFFVHFVFNKKYQTASGSVEMIHAYSQVVAMHIMLLAGGALLAATEDGTLAFAAGIVPVAFVIIKIISGIFSEMYFEGKLSNMKKS